MAVLILVLIAIATATEVYDIYADVGICEYSVDNAWIVTGTTGSFIYTNPTELTANSINVIKVQTTATLGDLISVEPYFMYYGCVVNDIEVHTGNLALIENYHTEDEPKESPCWNKGQAAHTYDGFCRIRSADPVEYTPAYWSPVEAGYDSGVAGTPLVRLGPHSAPYYEPNPPEGYVENTGHQSMYSIAWGMLVQRDIVGVVTDNEGVPVRDVSDDLFHNTHTYWLDLDPIYGLDANNPPMVTVPFGGINRTAVYERNPDVLNVENLLLKVIFEDVMDYHDYIAEWFNYQDLPYEKYPGSISAPLRAKFEAARQHTQMWWQKYTSFYFLPTFFNSNPWSEPDFIEKFGFWPTMAWTMFYPEETYNLYEHKVGNVPLEAAIDWYVTTRTNRSLWEQHANCPQKLMALMHQTPAQGFGSAPANPDEYVRAHEFAFALNSTYYDEFKCVYSHFDEWCFNENIYFDWGVSPFTENEEDESLFGKAHHDTTCNPDYHDGQFCSCDYSWGTTQWDGCYTDGNYPDTTRHSHPYYPDLDIANYEPNTPPEQLYTHWPYVPLALTFGVAAQSIMDDPNSFWTYGAAYPQSNYVVGENPNIVRQWMNNLNTCDFGYAYGTSYYGWGATALYGGGAHALYCNADTLDFYLSIVTDMQRLYELPNHFPWHWGELHACWMMRTTPDFCECTEPLFDECTCLPYEHI